MDFTMPVKLWTTIDKSGHLRGVKFLSQYIDKFVSGLTRPELLLRTSPPQAKAAMKTPYF
jgi:hypothetical protein